MTDDYRAHGRPVHGIPESYGTPERDRGYPPHDPKKLDAFVKRMLAADERIFGRRRPA